jgi:oxygen-independent coproporphyrinogen-3 oxidase
MLDFARFAAWDRPVPRYTSYPTAPQFHAMDPQIYRSHLRSLGRSGKPLSLYIHIPFCRSMCLFCGCSVILNRNPERQAHYVSLLLRELELVAAQWGRRRRLSQLHWGGGTPTSLSEGEFTLVMEALRRTFDLDADAEVAIEIDPRTVAEDEGRKLAHLRKLGFNRVSFGVQDLDPAVQEAVRRRQSAAVTGMTLQQAKALGFAGINVDLIYGLPFQTAAKFCATVQQLIAWKPDRIALFSYAQVPWLKPHQKAIRPETLPTPEEKFRIYIEARNAFLQAGYMAIGMDHFALPTDALSVAFQTGSLQRNFQGYSITKAEDSVGLGVTAIGSLEGAYFQNVKTLEEYEERIERGTLPVLRGFVLSGEDQLRRWVIHELMCRFAVDKGEFLDRFGVPFDAHFAKEAGRMRQMVEEGLVRESTTRIEATPLGQLFIRLVASLFDAYLGGEGRYSKAI